MKLDLSKFKRISMDDKTAVLEHPDGHTFHVAIKALHPENRKNLEKLEAKGGDPTQEHLLPGDKIPNAIEKSIVKKDSKRMAEGGEAKRSDKGPYVDPKKAKEVEAGANQSGWQPETWKKNVKAGLGLAKGGEIKAERMPDSNPLIIEHIEDKDPLVVEKIQQKQPKKMAEGGFPNPSPSMPEASPQEMPAQSAAAPQMASAAPQQASAQPMQGGLPQQAPMVGQNQPEPSSMEGFNNQVQGIQGQAQAESQEAKEKERAIKTQVSAVNNLMTSYQDHYNDLDKERQAFQADVQNSHIDANRYLGKMDTGQKFDTAVGLILGGLGGGGSSNLALDFLNKQIDRDIDAQKSELGKRETLLGANMKQFGNMRDATDMTRIMQNDLIINKLKQAEAKATSPMAKARAQQQIGALQMQAGPWQQQLATRRMLASGQPVQGIDPATLVHQLVPKEHQEAVYKEVERAQNTKNSADDILKDFDNAAGSLKSFGGLGRIGAVVHTPRTMAGLEAKLGTTVGDLEGSVRQAAMENVKGSFVPHKDDTDADLAKRRQALVEYLQTKSSAPRFKDYTGADLHQFNSTAKPTEGTGLDPQKQAFVKFARENPNDPRSAMILKKLGLQ